MKRKLTRRSALLGGLGGGLVAGGAGALLRAGEALADGDEAEVLGSAIAVEQALLLAYETGQGGGLLEKGVAETARLFAGQERQHVGALSRALRDLGGSVPEPPEVADVEGLAGVRSQTGFLELAAGLENAAVAAYGQAQRKLETPELLSIATRISANQGQHLVVLRQALGAGAAEAVPVAFEAGVTPPPKPEAG